MVISAWSLTTTQPLVEVKVTVAVPALTAAAFGVKTAFRVVALGEKEPGPDQIPVLPPAVTDPVSWAGLPAQIDPGALAVTTGAGVMVRLKDADVFGQEMLPVDVSVMMAFPEAISLLPGV